MVKDINPIITGYPILNINAGLLRVYNSTFQNISTSLFQLTNTKTIFSNVTISSISCSNSISPCILSGEYVTLAFRNSKIKDILSSQHLISIKFSEKTILHALQIENAQRAFVEDVQLFGLNANRVNNLTIEDSFFKNLTISVLHAEKSHVQISNSIFSNQIKKRLLIDHTNRALVNTDSDFPIQFLLFNSSNSIIRSSSFSQNALDTTINGGVNLLF